MKKILLLGGSAQQVIAIRKAKKLGYYTVLCDYLPDNPGRTEADVFYQISTTDKESILKVAKKERISGILAYASDPAATTAAFVANELGLPSNPADSVNVLCNKDRFRLFLKENGFHSPVSCSYCEKQIDKSLFKLPVIIKPVDSSGSKGDTILFTWDGLDAAAEYALSFSRSHKFIVEELVDKGTPYLVGGDIFVYHGRILLWGLMNCHRDKDVNPLVPAGKSYPPLLNSRDMAAIRETLALIVEKLNISFGFLNVEIIVDPDHNIWPIDIGPRAGGNMIPDLLGMIYGVDLVELAIQCAMGQTIRMPRFKADPKSPCFASYNLHSSKAGILEAFEFSQEIKPYIVKKFFFKKKGDPVEPYNNASKILGIVFFHFPSESLMFEILENIGRHIVVRII